MNKISNRCKVISYKMMILRRSKMVRIQSTRKAIKRSRLFSFLLFILQTRPRQTKRYVQCKVKCNGNKQHKTAVSCLGKYYSVARHTLFPSGSRSDIAFKRHLYQLIVSRFLEFFSREKGDSCLYMYICIYICMCACVLCYCIRLCVCMYIYMYNVPLTFLIHSTALYINLLSVCTTHLTVTRFRFHLSSLFVEQYSATPLVLCSRR